MSRAFLPISGIALYLRKKCSGGGISSSSSIGANTLSLSAFFVFRWSAVALPRRFRLTVHRLGAQFFEVLPVGLLRFGCPVVLPVEFLDEPPRQESLEVAHEYDVVFAVEVDPAVVAFP